ncbi:MAG: hypothetical protein M5U26_19065 [Planctomycetota bacterium]|nr:hypothetical protein [Planctomycetota bacterium]
MGPRFASRSILAACALSALCAIQPAGAGEGEGSPAPLAKLLANVEREPLLFFGVPDIHKLPARLAQAHLGQFLLDERYAEGRARLAKELGDAAGADLDSLWVNLRAHLEGPVALVLTRAAPLDEGDVPGFKLRLLASVPNAKSMEAVEAAWPRLPPQSGSLLSLLRPQLVAGDAAAAPPSPPAWVKEYAETPGLARFRARPEALGVALHEWTQALPESGALGWMQAVRYLAALKLETVALDLRLEGGQFEERLALKPLAGAEGGFVRLLDALRQRPRGWDGLTTALPSGSALGVLFQLEPRKLGADLAIHLQLFERMLRGKKWTEQQGVSEDALRGDRFDFLMAHATGMGGIVARPSPTGKVDLVLALASRERDVTVLRAKLVEGLGRLEAPFQTLQQAPRIGENAPLAAQFKGRGVLPAPVLGLSAGWIWLCSTTGAYHDLTAAFGGGKTLKEAPPPAQPDPLAAPFTRPESSTLRLDMNLEALAPLAYTAWLLSEDGPRLGDWRVPGEVLPQPGLFAGRLGWLQADLAPRADGTFLGYARGPLPFGSLLSVGVLGRAGEAVDQVKRGREALKDELRRLNEQDETSKAQAP